MTYAVHYASAGCIPDYIDDGPAMFDTVQEAAQYVVDEIDDMGQDVPDDEFESWLVGPTLQYVVENLGHPDPRPNSLYSWSIEEV